MTRWERDQEDYLLSKRDSEEMAAILFAAVILMVLAGLALEVWDRFLAPAMRWLFA